MLFLFHSVCVTMLRLIAANGWYSVGLICVHIISRQETTGRIRSSVTAAGAALLQLLCTLRHLNDNLLTSLQNCSLYTCDITATRRERHVQNSKGRELNITSPMSTCCTSHITSNQIQLVGKRFRLKIHQNTTNSYFLLTFLSLSEPPSEEEAGTSS